MTDNEETVSDTVAYYCVLTDVYKKKYKIRYKLFRWILRHIELCLGEESAIWLLMQEIKSNRTQYQVIPFLKKYQK